MILWCQSAVRCWGKGKRGVGRKMLPASCLVSASNAQSWWFSPLWIKPTLRIRRHKSVWRECPKRSCRGPRLNGLLGKVVVVIRVPGERPSSGSLQLGQTPTSGRPYDVHGAGDGAEVLRHTPPLRVWTCAGPARAADGECASWWNGTALFGHRSGYKCKYTERHQDVFQQVCSWGLFKIIAAGLVFFFWGRGCKFYSSIALQILLKNRGDYLNSCEYL